MTRRFTFPRPNAGLARPPSAAPRGPDLTGTEFGVRRVLAFYGTGPQGKNTIDWWTCECTRCLQLDLVQSSAIGLAAATSGSCRICGKSRKNHIAGLSPSPHPPPGRLPGEHSWILADGRLHAAVGDRSLHSVLRSAARNAGIQIAISERRLEGGDHLVVYTTLRQGESYYRARARAVGVLDVAAPRATIWAPADEDLSRLAGEAYTFRTPKVVLDAPPGRPRDASPPLRVVQTPHWHHEPLGTRSHRYVRDLPDGRVVASSLDGVRWYVSAVRGGVSMSGRELHPGLAVSFPSFTEASAVTERLLRAGGSG